MSKFEGTQAASSKLCNLNALCCQLFSNPAKKHPSHVRAAQADRQPWSTEIVATLSVGAAIIGLGFVVSA